MPGGAEAAVDGGEPSTILNDKVSTSGTSYSLGTKAPLKGIDMVHVCPCWGAISKWLMAAVSCFI